jgi:hypothetical protein
MRKELQIEIKVFGLYSLAARELNCTSGSVDAVYSFYIDEIYRGLKKTETKQIYLKGLGSLRANPACIPNILYSNVVRLRELTAYMLRVPKYHTIRKYTLMKKMYDNFESVYQQGIQKMDMLLELDIFQKPVSQKQRLRLAEFKETRLDKLYESICRLHQVAEARSEKYGQDSGGNQHENLERIQFTKR